MYLREQLIKLCSPPSNLSQYKLSIGALAEDDSAGQIAAFKHALLACNTYTTTLHAINSAIVKSGKLTRATKVYRGISGMALPKEFMETNEFGVMGGIENAFM